MSRSFGWWCCAGALSLSIQWCVVASNAVAQRYPLSDGRGNAFESPSYASYYRSMQQGMRNAKSAKNSRTSGEIPAEWRVEPYESSVVVDDGSHVEYPYGNPSFQIDDSCGSCGSGSYDSSCYGCGDAACGCGDGCYGCGTGCGAPYGCGSCDCGSCETCCATPCYPCGPKSRVFVDYLWLQTTDADIAHAQQQNGIGGAGTVPYGDIGTIEHEYDSGVRVGAVVGCDDCSGVYFSYTHFESDAFSSLDPPTIVGGGGAVGSLVHHPQASLTASNGPVDAEYKVSFDLTDLMFRRKWRGDGCYSVNYMLGIEYGHLEQDFLQSGIFGGGAGGDIDTSTSIDFDGGGLKVGIDTERQFSSCFAGYARLTASALSGRFSSRYTMYNVTTDTLLARANWKDDRVIGRVEYELGLALTSCNQRWRWATGYMFSYWANTVTTSDFIDAVQADNYVDVGDTISFSGLVTRLEARW